MEASKDQQNIVLFAARNGIVKLHYVYKTCIFNIEHRQLKYFMQRGTFIKPKPLTPGRQLDFVSVGGIKVSFMSSSIYFFDKFYRIFFHWIVCY